MDRITQEAYYRQRVLKYAAKHGVTKAAERYRMSRKTVHKWKRRYDGTVESLKNRSRAPLHSPLKQSDWEIQLVQRYAKKHLNIPPMVWLRRPEPISSACHGGMGELP